MQNITELRKSLTENYEEIKLKTMPIAIGKELANNAGKILTSLKVELLYNKMLGKKKIIPFLETKNKVNKSTKK
jgi:hypothetical protein